MSNNLQIKASSDDVEIVAAAHQIRDAVFIEEQKIAPELEYDGTDEGAIHYVGFVASVPVVTARVAVTNEGAHIQRVATVKSARRNGYAQQLLTKLMADITPQLKNNPNVKNQFYLGAQLTALPLYESLGFTATGPVFLDAGIKHRLLKLQV